MPQRLRRIYGFGHLHFITFSCYRWLPLLASARSRNVFVRTLDQVRCEYGRVPQESMNHRTSPTRSPHTDTITSQLNPVGAAILCRVCKECDVFRLPISDSACTVPLPCARKRSRTVSRHSQRVFYLTALGEGQRRGFSRHAFHPQPKTLRKLSSSLRRLAREHLCKGTVSTVPAKRKSNALPIARLTRAK